MSSDPKTRQALSQDSKRIWGLIRPHRRSYLLGFGSLAFSNFTSVLAPLFLAVSIDLAQANATQTAAENPTVFRAIGLHIDQFTLLSAIAVFLALHLASGLFQYQMIMRFAVPSHEIGQTLRNSLVERLLALSQPFYDRAKTGDLMSRVTTDVNAARMLLGPGVMVGLDTFLMMNLVVAMLMALSWKLTLVAIIPLPLIGVITNRLSHAEYGRFHSVQRDIAALTERVRASFVGMRIIQGYAREDFDRARFRDHSQTHLEKNLDLAKVKALFEPTLDLMLGASTILIIIFGGFQVVEGTLSLGTFVAFLFLITFLSGPMIGLGWAISLMQRGRASLHRIDELLEQPVEIEDPAEPISSEGPGTLVIRGLTFDYPVPLEVGAEAVVGRAHTLHDVELTVPAGETLGIVGPVGSGKSTLASLIVRLYDPPPGCIFVDGVDVREMSLGALRSRVGLAPQETFLFSDTIQHNLGLANQGDANTNVDDIRRFARLAELDDEVEALEAGYQTILGERGITLSGGQRQRLAIARAIAADPDILILDDCLSAVDAKTEVAILSNLREVFEGRTGIIISHRVAAVRSCDRIAVLELGTRVGLGSHEELLATNDFYATIARQQLGGEEPEDGGLDHGA